MIRIFLAGFLTVTLLVVVRGAQAPAAPRLADAFADVDRLFKAFVAERHVPGAAWGIIVDGQVTSTPTTASPSSAAS